MTSHLVSKQRRVHALQWEIERLIRENKKILKKNRKPIQLLIIAYNR